LYVLGIDIGSTTTKAVLLDGGGAIRGKALANTGVRPQPVIEKVCRQCCDEAGIKMDELDYCLATGYGRELVSFRSAQVTEITCHAKGAYALFPEVRTVLDIGGQDSKVISIAPGGSIANFVMNDQCAAGTGRFIEIMAGIMGISIEEMGKQSLLSENPLHISSVCTVFAESEVISSIASGADPVDIMAGIYQSVARRISGLMGRYREPPIVMTGGLAKNVGLVNALEKQIGTKFLIPESPQMVGALGAALIALERVKKTHDEERS